MTRDVSVARGVTVRLGRVDGRLDVAHGGSIRAAEGNLVVVSGDARFRGSANVDCDFECDRLTVERAGKLVVSGDLTVHDKLDVSNAVSVGGVMRADVIDVGGKLNARSVSCKRMRVGGIAEVSESLEAGLVEVGGKIESNGSLNVEELRVGGRAEIGGGTIKGIVNVGGRFGSSARLDFGELQVYGSCSLAAGSKGKKLDASGKFEAKGDLECEVMEISGVASISGNLGATRVEVRGKLEVSGSLSASGGLDVSGWTEVGAAFKGESLRVAGKFSAERALVTKAAEVYGKAETRSGLKAASVKIGNGTVCTGPIVGETVEVGESGLGVSAFFWGQRLRIQAGTSRVDDVYASTVSLGQGSRAGRIYAATVSLGPGCDVDAVTYVDELKMAEHVKIAHPVQKVDRLKEPPL